VNFQNSEVIFETIGNYPVVDQFDVLYTGLLSGSILDNYVTGTMVKRGLGGSLIADGRRGFVFSHVGNNSGKFPNNLSNETSYEYQPWSERAKITRTLKIFSSAERYYDSMTPKYDQLINVLGGSVESYSIYSFIRIGSSQSPYPNTALGFVESFPFEPIFSGVEKISRVSPKVDQKSLVVFVNNENAPISGLSWSNSSNPLDQLSDKDVANILFGFGDKSLVYSDAGDYFGSKHLPDHRHEYSFSGADHWISPILRGWKYGLIDANPRYTSTIFRRDKFGQFRDMLEQRYSATTVTDPVSAPTYYFGTLEESSAVSKGQLTENISYSPEYAVNVSFIKQELIGGQLIFSAQLPEDTQSSNLSTYMTSSLPFFDGISKNR